MDRVSVIGFIAGALTTASFIPQVIKIIITKSTKDISIEMFAAFSLGVFLWLIYGIFIKSHPVIIFNFITFILTCVILIFKLKYK